MKSLIEKINKILGRNNETETKVGQEENDKGGLVKKIGKQSRDKVRESNGINILPKGKWFNNRYDYAERFGGGVEASEETIMNTRYGGMNKKVEGAYFIEATGVGTKKLRTEEQKELVEYDTVIRSTPGFSGADNYYFLEGDYTGLHRNFTPSMGVGSPRDEIGEDTYIASTLRCARPLIEEMEEEIGRELVKEKYYE